MWSAQAFLLARLPWIVDCSIWPVSTPSHVFLDHFAILCSFLNVYHLSLAFFENAWHNDTWHFVVLWGAAWLPHRHLKSFIRFHEADLKAASLFSVFSICFLGRSFLFCMHSSLLACWLILFDFFWVSQFDKSLFQRVQSMQLHVANAFRCQPYLSTS